MAKRRKKGRSSKAKDVFSASGPLCVLPAPSREIHRFERTYYQGVLAPTLADKGWAFSFTLGNYPGASELTSLFDLYRMTSLDITFAVVGASAYDPTLMFCADYDSFSVPTTMDTVLQRPNKRVTMSSSQPTYTFRLRPRVMALVQTSSGTASSALAPASQWLDCNDSTVVYGGLVGWISQYNSSTNVSIAVTARACFDFAMVR